ncbi:hypothetical protein [Candidatus Avelusimicrobium sp.]
MAFYQMNFVLPTRKTFLTFFGVFVLLSLGLFQLFPVIFGGIVSLLLGTSDSLLVFFAHHEAVYGFFQDMIRTLYCCCVLGAFNFFFLVYLYKLLDEILTHSGEMRGLFEVAWRAWKPLMLLETSLLVLWALLGGNPLHFLPVFVSFSPLACFFMALAEILTIGFACGFAASESAKTAVQLLGKLLGSYWGSWLFIILLGVFIGWIPAFLLQAVGTESVGRILSFFLIIHGAISHFLFITLTAVMLFNRKEIFQVE